MQSKTIISKLPLSGKEIKQIMNTIEKKTEEQVMQLYKTDKIEDSKNGLLQIMKNGADEFETKTGEKMTYSQMREMFG